MALEKISGVSNQAARNGELVGIGEEVGVKAAYPANQTEGVGRRKDPFGEKGLECKGMWDYLGEVGDHRKQV
jgi:hypothetical protein